MWKYKHANTNIQIYKVLGRITFQKIKNYPIENTNANTNTQVQSTTARVGCTILARRPSTFAPAALLSALSAQIQIYKVLGGMHKCKDLNRIKNYPNGNMKNNPNETNTRVQSTTPTFAPVALFILWKGKMSRPVTHTHVKVEQYSAEAESAIAETCSWQSLWPDN